MLTKVPQPVEARHVAIYLRISHDPLDLRAGVGRQLSDCKTLAARRFPDTPTHIYEDNDVSAYSGRTRAAFQRLTAAIKSHDVRAVVAYDLDRLLRLPRELEALIELCDAAALHDVVTASGDLDLSTHDGQLMARIMVAVAKKSSDDASRRVRRAKQQRSQDGLFHGGHAPFGYRLVDGHLHPDPDTSRELQRASAHVLSGGTLRSIAGTGTLPRSRQGVRLALMNPAIVSRNRAGVHGAWLPLVDETTYAALLDVLGDVTRVPSRSPHRQFWLTGIARCALCDGPMYSHTKARLRCGRCTGVSVNMQMAQELVSEMLMARVEVREEGARGGGQWHQEGVGGAELPLLAADYAAGRITRPEWLAAREVLVRRTPPRPVASRAPVPLAELWPAMDVGERHHVATEMLRAVRVLPAPVAHHPNSSLARTLGELLSRLVPMWRV